MYPGGQLRWAAERWRSGGYRGMGAPAGGAALGTGGQRHGAAERRWWDGYRGVGAPAGGAPGEPWATAQSG